MSIFDMSTLSLSHWKTVCYISVCVLRMKRGRISLTPYSWSMYLYKHWSLTIEKATCFNSELVLSLPPAGYIYCITSLLFILPHRRLISIGFYGVGLFVQLLQFDTISHY